MKNQQKIPKKCLKKFSFLITIVVIIQNVFQMFQLVSHLQAIVETRIESRTHLLKNILRECKLRRRVESFPLGISKK